ncbi:dimethyl sulfoxide reductase anchor subunit family protein [Neobacillus niacini]|uniref:dimethyl sulfoxide reductase anchor subunit family protein n=1 Tax=Neobacillus niacini TaxID=86668 RepID=UPI00203FFDD9|nr:DmsC/YnfH family molybdoenzyme membrane anchor subunit [Neobacillus niacini]MCM3691867.1 dimethyl sulfoxide reductase anchor subunit [Neobacillus niacini]
MHEWPLLLFTVSIPAAVGSVLFLWLIHGRIAALNGDKLKAMKLPLLVTVVVSFIGLIASFFHLGSPENAFNVLRGFGRSWMSNEIVFTGAFIALVCLLTGLMLLQQKVYPILLLITGIIGLVDIYCMASAYAVTRVNGWDHLNTYVVFYGTAFSLGPVLAASMMLQSLEREEMKKIVKWAFLIGILGVAIQVIGSAMFAGYTPEVQVLTGETAAAKLEPYTGMIGFRWAIEMLGLGVMGYLSLSSKPKISYSLVYAALLVFVVAEGMSRYVFYVLGA